MKAFVMLHFILSSFLLVTEVVMMLTIKFPRQREPETVGWASANLILLAAIVFWTSFLLWGR